MIYNIDGARGDGTVHPSIYSTAWGIDLEGGVLWGSIEFGGSTYTRA